MSLDKYQSFLEGAASPYHVVDMVEKNLEENGFEKIREAQDWDIKPNQGYYFIRDQTCIVAFVTPDHIDDSTPFSIIGTHTDSPVLKLKPRTYLEFANYNVIPVEPYGSPIYSSWFDRPLRLGGRVIIKTEDGLHSKLIKFNKPVGVIPNLAIHMWSSRTNPPPINLSTHIRVVLSSDTLKDEIINGKTKKHTICMMHPQNKLLLRMVVDELNKNYSLNEEEYDIISWDLEFSDFAKPCKVGNYLVGEKQDNLVHCFTAMESIIKSKKKHLNSRINMVAMFNNEEIGSTTREGARCNIIFETIKKITSARSIPHSFMLSADVSHGLHPNYPDESDSYSRALLGCGICLKIDSNCGYSNNAALTSVVLDIVNEHNKTASKDDVIRIQSVAKKNGTAGGSTIGPMSASGNHIRTSDVGIPLLAMHSISETVHVDDIFYAERLFSTFLDSPLDVKFFDELD